MNITHCIFDSDGTLINTENLYSDVLNELFDEYGFLDIGKRTDIIKKIKGFTQFDSTQYIISETGIKVSVNKLTDKRNKNNVLKFEKEKILPMPGAMRLITHLYNNKIPMAVATSSNRINFKIKSSKNKDLFKMFNSITCGDDVTKGKPAPDVFLEAWKKMGEPPKNQVLVFEDSLNGIMSAINAGMNVIGIVEDDDYDEGYSNINGLSEVIHSLEDFNPKSYGLPSF